MRKLKNEELNRLTIEEFSKQDKAPIVIVLDNVRSHLNVGSIFRTADAFLIESIYICGITGTPPHRDIHKTALGATDTVVWHYSDSTLKAVLKLKADGYSIISIEQAVSASQLNIFKPIADKKYAIVFGNEVDGVSQEIVSVSDTVIEIPQYGMKHSLNVSVSVGVVIWDFFSKLLEVKEK